MVVRIRLQRMGRRNLPFYRIVVADSRAPRDGRFIENVRSDCYTTLIYCESYFFRELIVDLNKTLIMQIGTYNPIPCPKDGIKEITANSERAIYWLTCGAQPSDRVAWIFGIVGN